MVKLWISKTSADELLRQFEGREAHAHGSDADRAFEELYLALGRALRPDEGRRAGQWGQPEERVKRV